MSQVVIDASLAVKLVLIEEDSETARRLWLEWSVSETERVAPALFAFECVSAIRWNVIRKWMTIEEADMAFHEFLAFAKDVQLVMPPMLNERAWEITKKLGQGQVYDAYYVALAEILECELWTADDKLYRAASHIYPKVKHLHGARRK